MTRKEKLGVGALGFIVLVTVAWWSLALWPPPGEVPAWLARARAVCFNATENGLPDASGWLLLVGQPLGMAAVLLVGWRDAVLGGLRGLAASGGGRAVLVLTAVGLLVGVGAARSRVLQAEEAARVSFSDDLPPSTYPRLDRPAPGLGLVDQHGARYFQDELEGRPALVTFAFGHCATVCPMVVEGALEARRRWAEARPGSPPIPVVVITLDPWRDTPSRLSHLAENWKLGPADRILSGEVGEVNAVLDAWKVTRQRNESTGDVVHPALVYVLDGTGRIAFASPGLPGTLLGLLRRI